MMVTAVPESAALSNVHYLIIKKEKCGVENSPSSLSHLVQPVVYLYPWQPEGRASYEIKATGSQETGHICFDVFTLHKRRWQPLNVSRLPMSSSPPAATSLSLVSLSGSDISKSITRPQKKQKQECILSSSLHAHSRSDFFELFDVTLCCYFDFLLRIWNLPACLKEDEYDHSSLSTDGSSQQNLTVICTKKGQEQCWFSFFPRCWEMVTLVGNEKIKPIVLLQKPTNSFFLWLLS